MPDEVILDVTTIEENVTVETTAGDVVGIQVVAPTGPTGATGPAGPNSVTSATTSDGTANLSLGDLEVVGGEIYTDGEYSNIYTQGDGAEIFTIGTDAIIYTQGADAHISTSGDSATIYTSGASGSIYTTGANAGISTVGANATMGTLGTNATISTAGSAAHIQTNHASAAVKSTNFAAVESGGASLVDGSFQPCLTWSAGGRNLTIPSGTAVTFDSTNYTYGTGAAAAHRTALGLTTLATTTPAANVATFLATPTSDNLASALTDENGTGGGFVRAEGATLTSPTLVGTPVFNATAYTYGTGAAAAHRAALGLGDLSTVAASTSITGATTLTSAAFGVMHICSGTSADYTVTLPSASGNAGRVIALSMSPALTKFVTIAGAGGALINGSATRIMWASESAILYCDGTNWNKIGGYSRPMSYVAENGAGVTIATNTSQVISMATVITNNTGSMSDTVSSFNVARIRRAGSYSISALVSYERTGLYAGFESYCIVAVNNVGTAYTAWAVSPAMISVVPTSVATQTYSHATLAQTRMLTSNDYLALHGYQVTAGNMMTRTIAQVRPYLSVIEIPNW